MPHLRKRKLDRVPDDASTGPPASSEKFTSLISKYSYKTAKPDELDTNPSTSLIKPCKTSRLKTSQSLRSPTRNPGYAPPSAYAHVPTPDLDRLAEGLILLFIGLNPGIATALANHSFAGATNKFWPLLYSSRITTLRHTYRADRSLPSLYRVGITNLIPRPTRCASELSKDEMLTNVDVLEDKIRTWKPMAVCVVGKGIWDVIYERKTGGKVGKDFEFGWQGMRMGGDDQWKGAGTFVTPSTSGRVAAYSREYQEVLWKKLGDWVREERGDSTDELQDEETGRKMPIENRSQEEEIE